MLQYQRLLATYYEQNPEAAEDEEDEPFKEPGSPKVGQKRKRSSSVTRKNPLNGYHLFQKALKKDWQDDEKDKGRKFISVTSEKWMALPNEQKEVCCFFDTIIVIMAYDLIAILN